MDEGRAGGGMERWVGRGRRKLFKSRLFSVQGIKGPERKEGTSREPVSYLPMACVPRGDEGKGSQEF